MKIKHVLTLLIYQKLPFKKKELKERRQVDALFAIKIEEYFTFQESYRIYIFY